jgi:hypothetical protein
VITIKVGLMSYRVEHYNLGLNSEGMKLDLDLLEEKRNKAQIMMAEYQRRLEQYFNKVRHWDFAVGDWVLQKVTFPTRNSKDGKLEPKWEGPY